MYFAFQVFPPDLDVYMYAMHVMQYYTSHTDWVLLLLQSPNLEANRAS